MTPERYHFAARVLHWLMAAGFLLMWVCGFTMTTLVEEDSLLEELLFALHISVGVTLLGLLVVRVAVRLAYRAPALPVTLTPFEQGGARAGHVALYVLPVIVIALGWAEVGLGGHTLHWFGVELPGLLPPSEAGEELAADWHKYIAYTMLAVAAGHVGFALKHRWEGRDVIHRMGFGRWSDGRGRL